jgi:hypothetical protein
VVPDGVLKDALEQEREFRGRPVGIVLGELQHRVLHDVERRLLLLDREDALLERATLDRGEEIRQFFSGGQGGSSPGCAALGTRPAQAFLARRPRL